MRLYPKVIPTIAREVVQTLMQDGDAEIETLRIADAEMDMAAIMKEYLAAEERVNAATREALERRGYDHSRFNQVKREMADVRGFKMGDEGIEYVIGQMIEFLLISRNVEGSTPRPSRSGRRCSASSRSTSTSTTRSIARRAPA